MLAQNTFNKPTNNSSTFTLFYYEVKIKFESENEDDVLMKFGLCCENEIVLRDENRLYSRRTKESFCVGDSDIKDGDIVGCGLMYSPSKIFEIPTHMFSTRNGELIG